MSGEREGKQGYPPRLLAPEMAPLIASANQITQLKLVCVSVRNPILLSQRC